MPCVEGNRYEKHRQKLGILQAGHTAPDKNRSTTLKKMQVTIPVSRSRTKLHTVMQKKVVANINGSKKRHSVPRLPI